jgi:hypothetical protein
VGVFVSQASLSPGSGAKLGFFRRFSLAVRASLVQKKPNALGASGNHRWRRCQSSHFS